MGVEALDACTTGIRNTGLGQSAAGVLTTGDRNTAVGNFAMGGVSTATTGDQNTALGDNAGRNITSGSTNTVVGNEAGFNLTSGSNNTLIGHDAGTANSPSGNTITGDNVVCLGDSSVQFLCAAVSTITTSDSRDKTDVQDFTQGLSWINSLRPVTYKWDRRTWDGTKEQPYGTPDGSKKQSRVHVGFLAQEVLDIEKANGYGDNNDNSLLVTLNTDGMGYGIGYERVVPMLVNAIKELSTRVTALEAG